MIRSEKGRKKKRREKNGARGTLHGGEEEDGCTKSKQRHTQTGWRTEMACLHRSVAMVPHGVLMVCVVANYTKITRAISIFCAVSQITKMA